MLEEALSHAHTHSHSHPHSHTSTHKFHIHACTYTHTYTTPHNHTFILFLHTDIEDREFDLPPPTSFHSHAYNTQFLEADLVDWGEFDSRTLYYLGHAHFEIYEKNR